MFTMQQWSTPCKTGAIEARLDALGAKIDDLARGIDKRFEQVDKRFEQLALSIDKRIEQVDKRFDKRFEQVERRLEGLESRFFRLQLAMIGGLAGVIATLMPRRTCSGSPSCCWLPRNTRSFLFKPSIPYG